MSQPAPYHTPRHPDGGATLTVQCDAENATLTSGPCGPELRLAIPLLGGSGQHIIAAGRSSGTDGLRLIKSQDMLAGAVVFPRTADLRSAVRDGYRRILESTRGLHLWRIWNTVPDINACVSGMENYRAFNAGRFDAIAAALGLGFRGQLPAASAVGCRGSNAGLYFLAGEVTGRHFENPQQASSWDYPSEFGNPPPAFARGTVVETASAVRYFLSGTAGIRGHATIGTSLSEQFQVMAENIQLMLKVMETPDTASGDWRCFLRHESDLPAAQSLFAAAFPQAYNNIQWLRADICRADLLIEIEAAFYIAL